MRQGIEVVGDFSLFSKDAFAEFAKLWHRRGLFLRQCEFIGVSSMAIVAVAASFLGGVLGYQLFVSFHLFGAEALLGASVGVSLFRELGPVMTAIMVTGRAGAAMAAEISSMRISEQIDALEVMAVNPMEYLVAPRVAAGIVMLPILAVFFSCVGSMVAALVACDVMGLSYSVFWDQFRNTVDRLEIIHCLVKASVFGLVFTLLGCYCGYRARGGARAVGLATRSTVVSSCLTILLSDYVLTSLLPFGFKKLQMN